jgi:hypothetical protein
MSGRIYASVGIYQPAPDDIRLSITPDAVTLRLHTDVWLSLGDTRPSLFRPADLAEEAAAMRKLAALAVAAATELDRRAEATP